MVNSWKASSVSGRRRLSKRCAPARPDGLGRLPPHSPQPPRRRGRLPVRTENVVAQSDSGVKAFVEAGGVSLTAAESLIAFHRGGKWEYGRRFFLPGMTPGHAMRPCLPTPRGYSDGTIRRPGGRPPPGRRSGVARAGGRSSGRTQWGCGDKHSFRPQGPPIKRLNGPTAEEPQSSSAWAFAVGLSNLTLRTTRGHLPRRPAHRPRPRHPIRLHAGSVMAGNRRLPRRGRAGHAHIGVGSRWFCP